MTTHEYLACDTEMVIVRADDVLSNEGSIFVMAGDEVDETGTETGERYVFAVEAGCARDIIDALVDGETPEVEVPAWAILGDEHQADPYA